MVVLFPVLLAWWGWFGCVGVGWGGGVWVGWGVGGDVGWSVLFGLFVFQAEDGNPSERVTGIQTGALPICWGLQAKTLHVF